MRREDLDRLRKPYPTERPCDLADGLDLDVVAIRRLARLISDDLDPVALGVGWWAPHPGTSRRILISDYLLRLSGETEFHLTGAAVHLLELRDLWEQEQRVMADCVVVDGRGVPTHVKHPARLAPVDDLLRFQIENQLTGFFRAIGSTLDCFSGAAIGVLGLPTRIFKADLGVLQRELDRARKAPQPYTKGLALQVSFADALDTELRAAGPPGWASWASDYRNMAVHRARRHVVNMVTPYPSVLGPNGRPIVRAEIQRHLPVDPGDSDIQVFARAEPSAWILAERAEVTLAGILRSTNQLVERGMDALCDAWQARKSQPSLIAQPRAQWPEGLMGKPTGFLGYDPSARPPSPSSITAGPVLVRRLQMASLVGDARKAWPGFD